jgi:hypothetical protein
MLSHTGIGTRVFCMIMVAYKFPCSIPFPSTKLSDILPQRCVQNNLSEGVYQIYIPGQRQIKVSRDVTFEEKISLRRSRESHMEIDSEKKEETLPSPPSVV